MQLLDRYQAIQERIQTACERAGRAPDAVHLLAVSKTFPVEAIQELAALGQRDFGENYVQEASAKVGQVEGAHWHLIGPLQRNKAGPALDIFDTIHSLDRLELALRLEQLAAQRGRTLDAFVQIRLGDEESKSGLDPDTLEAELERWSAHPWQALRLVGLMTLPPPQVSRPHFARLRELAERFCKAPLFVDSQLSMGMSEDFEAAIAEGSHWVRVGRALFGAR